MQKKPEKNHNLSKNDVSALNKYSVDKYKYKIGKNYFC